MADDNGSTIPAAPQYWLIPLEFAWREFSVAHRERLSIYAGLAPVIRTQIELEPELIDKITGSAGVQVNKMLLFGAAAVVAIMLFMRR